MAIGLKEINNKSKRGLKSILDVILERNEDRVVGKKVKKKVLRPWQLNHDGLNQYSDEVKKSTIMSPFDKKIETFNDDELMARKITQRANELFVDIFDFL